MYNLEEVKKAYRVWKHNNIINKKVIAVSFCSKDLPAPYTFSGVGILTKIYKKKIFTSREIKYLKSLKDGSGKALFPARFMDFLSLCVFDFSVKFIKEGVSFFPGEPILVLETNSIEMVFLQVILDVLVSREIYTATAVEKIATMIAPSPVLIHNTAPDGEKWEESMAISSYIGGAQYTTDIKIASKLAIPIVSFSSCSDLVLLHLCDELKKEARFSHFYNKNVCLSGRIDQKTIDDIKSLGIHISSVNIDLAFLFTKKMESFFHKIRSDEIMSEDFQFRRFSYRGLYRGDILSSRKIQLEEEKIFEYDPKILEVEELFFQELGLNAEGIKRKQDRMRKNICKLALKYRNGFDMHKYPVKITPNMKHQIKDESLIKIKLA